MAPPDLLSKKNPINIWSGISAIKPGSLIYQEAKKHIAEMLDTGDQRASLPTTAHVSESLGSLLSTPEYNALSPNVSHGSDKELVLPYEETGSLPMQQFNQDDATSSLSLSKQSLAIKLMYRCFT